MSAKKYHVSLTEAERNDLVRLSKSQRHSERERKRARILLLADEAKEGGAGKDTAIAQQVRLRRSPSTALVSASPSAACTKA